ncbi:MAG: hypothetical protein AAF667_20295 [Pseudomonadota bacterium]
MAHEPELSLSPLPDGSGWMAQASCVAIHGRGLLIIGKSGSGKSSLALQLIALGASLVADDRTCLRTSSQGVEAFAPAAIEGQIEARGVGILRLPVKPFVPLRALVDLKSLSSERLPEPEFTTILSQRLRRFQNFAGAAFPAALFLYMSGQGDADE